MELYGDAIEDANRAIELDKSCIKASGTAATCRQGSVAMPWDAVGP